jgi:hypothetical protein
MPTAALIPSKFSDAMRCLTTYEPRADPDAHLVDFVIPENKWERQILEYFMEKHVITKAKAQGTCLSNVSTLMTLTRNVFCPALFQGTRTSSTCCTATRRAARCT